MLYNWYFLILNSHMDHGWIAPVIINSMSLKSQIKNAITFIPNIVKQNDRKSFWRIIAELTYLAVKNKTLPAYYFSKHLYKKDVKNIHDYFPAAKLYSIRQKLNDQDAAKVLDNKMFFHMFFQRYITSLPKFLMSNQKNLFLLDTSHIVVTSIKEFETILYNLVENYSATKSIFIKKTYASYGGSNTYRISLNDFPINTTTLESMFKEITKSSYLFQETISQHVELNKLNPSCLNTVRMDTFFDIAGNVEIMSSFLRMSLTNLHADNVSLGGCCVGINDQTGKLMKYGYSSITKTGGSILTSHPKTGLTFQNFVIPYYYEAKQLVLKAAHLIPNVRLIGWDIAISDSGPILVEGNHDYDISANDKTYGGYKSNPVFRKVLEEINMYH